MAFPTIFANLAAGNQSLALFDVMFSICAQISTIPSTATGQNAIVLTPIGNAPTLAAYARFNTFSFKAVATSNAAVTAQFTSLAALPVYKRDGVTQAGANDLISGQFYYLVYDSALNAGGGGFFLEISTLPLVATGNGGSFTNLTIANNSGTPDTQTDVTIGEVVMIDPSTGASLRAATASFTINAALNGAVNRLDTGTLAASTWYYVWAISNGVTTGGLLSLSSTAPTMPSGYTYQKRIGSVRTDFVAGASSVVTISTGSPGVITWAAHGQIVGTPVVFTTTGSLPTGLTVGTTYYIISAGFAAGAFEVSASPNGAAINTLSAGSGVHTATVPGVRLMRTRQNGRRVQYVMVAAPASTIFAPLIANGTAGTYSTTNPALAAVSIANVAPPTASEITVMATDHYQNLTSAAVLVAPNTSWGGTANGPEGAIGQVWPIARDAVATYLSLSATFVLEASTIAWASSNTGGAISCLGWVDNL